jgi:ribosomal protein S13
MATKEKEVNLHHAMVNVMQEVKNIEKGLTVGSGNFSYKGVSDKDVKQQIGQAMAKNGLTCVPVKFEPTTKIDRWEEEAYGKIKQKVSVFVEVLATFRITHADTKETIDIVGYGHGQDNSDKAAGKATTYALKNALLYSFLVPTGEIDDTDNTHSNDIQQAPKEKPALSDEKYAEALPHVLSGATTIGAMEKHYKISAKQKKDFNNALAEKAKENIDATAKEGAAKMTAKSEAVVDPAPEAPKEEVVPEATKEEVKKEKKAPAKKRKKSEPKVEEATVVEGGELTGIEKVKSHIDEYTSSDAIIKDKNVIELDIKLEKLTDDEADEVKKYVNEVYNKLKDAGL